MASTKDILIRSGSGAVFVALLVGATLLSKLAIGALFAVAAFIGIQEVLALINRNDSACDRGATMFSSAVLFTGFAAALAASNNSFVLPAVALAVMLPFIHQLLACKQPNFSKALVSSAVPMYVGLPLILLVLAANLTPYYQPYILLGILLLTWTYDTFAYLVGSWIGKTRLLERVSPKKSFEGLAGGAIFAFFGAWIYAQFNNDLSFYHWLVLAGIVVVFGTLGDLTESVLKRNYEAKDSGSLMPGHGGILDRFDALLFIGPAAYTYLLFVLN